MEYQAAVIGGGPAGLSAALWLGRYRRNTVLFESGEQRNRWVKEAHGYYGFDGIDPGELRERALTDLKRYQTVEVRELRVDHARRAGDRFELETSDGVFAAERIVLATGVRDCYPEIENLFEHYGTSVFNCPSCDGFEAEGKRVVVFGWSEEIVTFSQHLLEWASSVTIVTDGARFEGDVPPMEPITVVEQDAVELVGSRGDLRAVRLASGEEIETEMAFFAIDQKPATELASEVGVELTDLGCTKVDADGKTSVEGFYAAGDIVQGPQLIQVAAATGAIAGINCARSL